MGKARTFEDKDSQRVGVKVIKEEVESGGATKRVGCIGLDWAYVGVRDLFKIFDSFLLHSSPKSVKLYKTKLGKEKLGDNNVYTKSGTKGRISEYYVAIAEFKTIEDSILVYNSCDGSELERSGMSFDLRFISDDLVLENVCDEALGCSNYTSKEFISKSRQNELEDNEDSSEERETELRKLFEQKEIDFDAVHKFVDMSDDEEAHKDSMLLIPNANMEDISYSDEGPLNDDSDLEEDLNEAYKSLSKKNKKKKNSEKENVVKESKKSITKMILEEKVEDECKGFVFNPRDERFEVLFEDDGFAIDPTHPEYKKKGGMKEILNEKRKRFKDMAD